MACGALKNLVGKSKDEYLQSLLELDFWLRSDGNRRNPGTTADLVTAGLFVGIVNQNLSAPFQ